MNVGVVSGVEGFSVASVQVSVGVIRKGSYTQHEERDLSSTPDSETYSNDPIRHRQIGCHYSNNFDCAQTVSIWLEKCRMVTN
jgi:hypothetical protein